MLGFSLMSLPEFLTINSMIFLVKIMKISSESTVSKKDSSSFYLNFFKFIFKSKNLKRIQSLTRSSLCSSNELKRKNKFFIMFRMKKRLIYFASIFCSVNIRRMNSQSLSSSYVLGTLRVKRIYCQLFQCHFNANSLINTY